MTWTWLMQVNKIKNRGVVNKKEKKNGKIRKKGHWSAKYGTNIHKHTCTRLFPSIILLRSGHHSHLTPMFYVQVTWIRGSFNYNWFNLLHLCFVYQDLTIQFGHVKGASTYLGAAPIVQCLERYKPHVVITSRVADAALFLAPMVWKLSATFLFI